MELLCRVLVLLKMEWTRAKIFFSKCYRSILQYVACPLSRDEQRVSVQVWSWIARIAQIFVQCYGSERFWQSPIPYYWNVIQAPKVDAVDSTADPVEHEEVKISWKNSAAAVPTDESEYDDEYADDRNDET